MARPMTLSRRLLRFNALLTVLCFIIVLGLLAKASLSRFQDPSSALGKSVNFTHGTKDNAVQNVKPSYDRALVIAATEHEDTRWTNTWSNDPSLEAFVYMVDDPEAVNKVPKNKGREAMVYLTYIIDHYHNLANTSIFMHAGRRGWHNDGFMNGDSFEMITRLNTAKVQRDGYMNLRCLHEPGCPAHIHPFAKDSDPFSRPEEPYMANAWKHMFPDVAVPKVLAQPCCSQFAASSNAIRARPLSHYIQLREFILETVIDDGILGRIFEYVWQYAFTGKFQYCPDELACYCEGYGACFVDAAEKDEWYKLYKEFLDVREQAGRLAGPGEEGRERKKQIGDTSIRLKKELDRRREEIFERKTVDTAKAATE